MVKRKYQNRNWDTIVRMFEDGDRKEEIKEYFQYTICIYCSKSSCEKCIITKNLGKRCGNQGSEFDIIDTYLYSKEYSIESNRRMAYAAAKRIRKAIKKGDLNGEE